MGALSTSESGGNGDQESPCRVSCALRPGPATVLETPTRCASGEAARSTVAILKRFPLRKMLPEAERLLVPRGGIEPPTRGFSVYFLSSEAVRLPLGTSVKAVRRPVKAAAVRHN